MNPGVGPDRKADTPLLEMYGSVGGRRLPVHDGGKVELAGRGFGVRGEVGWRSPDRLRLTHAEQKERLSKPSFRKVVCFQLLGRKELSIVFVLDIFWMKL